MRRMSDQNYIHGFQYFKFQQKMKQHLTSLIDDLLEKETESRKRTLTLRIESCFAENLGICQRWHLKMTNIFAMAGVVVNPSETTSIFRFRGQSSPGYCRICSIRAKEISSSFPKHELVDCFHRIQVEARTSEQLYQSACAFLFVYKRHLVIQEY